MQNDEKGAQGNLNLMSTSGTRDSLVFLGTPPIPYGAGRVQPQSLCKG